MKNTIIRAECIDMTYEGYGVCRLNELVIFVKGMIDGEIADIKIISHKKNMAYAIIDKLIKKSQHRIEPLCKVAYKCGGCDLRHISYDYQLELKKRWVKNTVKNISLMDLEVKDVVPSPLENNYRNKVQIPCADGVMGFYRNNSHDIVETDNCVIQSELSNEIIEKIKTLIKKYHVDKYIRHVLIKHAFGTGEIMLGIISRSADIEHLQDIVEDLISSFDMIKSIVLNINTRNDNVILGDEEIVLYGNGYITDILDGLKFRISLKSFYQVNSLQTVNLYNEVVKRADINKDTRVLDLYSGIGSISLFVARYAKEVTGVEIVEAAVNNAKENARINHLDNVSFYLEDASCNQIKHLKDKDVVIVDPPRKGLSRVLIKDIAQSDISKVVYVSCNPATLARDISYFNEEGYTCDYVRPFDMFPHSVHVENVVLMSRLNTHKE